MRGLLGSAAITAIVATVWSCSLGASETRYSYTIEVTAYTAPGKAAQPATVEFTWPSGSRTVVLEKPRDSCTCVVSQPNPKPKPGVMLSLAVFTLNVRVTKPGYEKWEASFGPADFVRTGADRLERIDQVRLREADASVTEPGRSGA